jgi:hypothetical protein
VVPESVSLPLRNRVMVVEFVSSDFRRRSSNPSPPRELVPHMVIVEVVEVHRRGVLPFVSVFSTVVLLW